MYLGAFLAALVFALPVLAALLIPTFFVDSVWYVVSVPFAILYAAGIYFMSLKIGEPMLMSGEIELIQKVSSEE